MKEYSTATTKIKWKNGVTLNAVVEMLDKNLFSLSYEPAYDREEYEEYGTAGLWDEANIFSQHTKTEPIIKKSLTEINKIIKETDQSNQNISFRIMFEELVAVGG
jgi:hypothetical protein